jgi:hypothetical protein
MTHGDKAKAKAAKSNKASAKEVRPKGGENGKSKAVGQSVKAGQASKTQSGKADKTGESAKASPKAGGEKAAAPKKGSSPVPKESSSRAAPAEAAGGFANAAIGAAFRQAVKKYPNALRKLTD